MHQANPDAQARGDNFVPPAIYYPSGDGQPMAETGIHVWVMVLLIATLRQYFGHRSDVYVVGNIFLYYQEGNPDARRSPDVMVVKGVSHPEDRRSFMTWEEGVVPTVIFEITSQKTADEDFGPKKELYQQLGVREYFLFDPLHEYLEQPLMGYRLIPHEQGATYEPLLPDSEGSLFSNELALKLTPEGTELGLFDFHDQRVHTPPQVYQLYQQSKERATRAEQERDKQRQLLTQAEERFTQAEERAKLAEQERDEQRQRLTQAEERAKRAEERQSQSEEQLRNYQQQLANQQQLMAELERLRRQLGTQQDAPSSEEKPDVPDRGGE